MMQVWPWCHHLQHLGTEKLLFLTSAASNTESAHAVTPYKPFSCRTLHNGVMASRTTKWERESILYSIWVIRDPHCYRERWGRRRELVCCGSRHCSLGWQRAS